ncbi:uncharacterized protein MELLADRAFT_61689 [Melampsora larici-populina 98AG31]|uniref:Secreted protein n=1 Tax=Melampsora larici-populina (strain 98AG31 / pathotype 3-4-7) TaxID=747676 RepID=F4RFX2_MELLP|nr:uncharacterized protein MELLADRAFT_61689 [Melampsora larici-populina 98AG31]EGG08717.1 hypothetical protein MELLADRAFT_61689 [Melampsora larici-populina 98AG31]
MSQFEITILIWLFWLCNFSLCMEKFREHGLELSLGISSELESTNIKSPKPSSSSNWFKHMKIDCDQHDKVSCKKTKITTSDPKMQESAVNTYPKNVELQDLHSCWYYENSQDSHGWCNAANLNIGFDNRQKEKVIGSDTGKRYIVAPTQLKDKQSISSVVDESTISPNGNLNYMFRQSAKRPLSTKTPPAEKASKFLFGFDLNISEQENELEAKGSGDTEVVPDLGDQHSPETSKKSESHNHIPESSTSEHSKHRDVDELFHLQRQIHTSQSVHDIFSPQSPPMMNDRQVKIGIDIQRFKEHKPMIICSSAAIHFTWDLVSVIHHKYTYRQNPGDNMIEMGKKIWTFDILLPQVYFLLTLNPSLAMWNRIKGITGILCRAYHSWLLDDKQELNQEHLSRFLLWHTDVIYQICRNRSISKSIEEGGNETFRDLMVKRMSSLPRILKLVYKPVDNVNLLRYKNTNSFIYNHFSITWKSDFLRGYPDARLLSSGEESISKLWNTKSREIMQVGRTLSWPKYLLYKSPEKPVLLVHEDVGRDIENEKNVEVRDFLIKWKTNFESMLSSTMNQRFSRKLPVSDLECYCLGFDHIVSTYSERSHPSTGLCSSAEYNVKLFGNFLSHDFSVQQPGTGIRQDFWTRFPKKLTNDYARSLRRIGKRKY